MTDLKLIAKLAPQYLGGLAHVHTLLSNYPHHRESNLSLRQMAGLTSTTPGQPWHYLAVTEHTSNPARPQRTIASESHHAALTQAPDGVDGLQLIRGIEVSILPDSTLDVSDDYLRSFDLVIASRHSLPKRTEKSPVRLHEHLCAAMAHPGVDVIGHPGRYVTEVKVDWTDIFDEAARTHTAVEVNLNTFPAWPRFGGERRLRGPMRWWRGWLQALAESGAPVFIGSDIHERHQLQLLQREWQRLMAGDSKAHHDRLTRLLFLLQDAGITPERVISRDYDTLQQWLAVPKRQRSGLQ